MNKQMFKLVAVLMSFILFIHAFPSFPIPVSAESVTEETTEKTEAVPVMEVLEKRSEYAKHYHMSDGTYKMVTYPTPVHYQTDSEWAEIDQTLISSGNRLIPRSSPLEVSFGTTAGDTLFSLKDRETDQELSFDLLNRQATPPETTLTANDSVNAELIETQPDPYAVADRLKNKLTYQNVLAGTDIEYELTSNRIKESIIIESASSTQNYTFRINGSDYRLVLESDNSVSIYRKADNSLAYVIEAPYMFDAAGAESTDIEVTIAEVKGTWLMNLAPSSSWLNHTSRTYPVTLDPTVRIPYLGEFIKAASHKGSTVTHLSATSGMLESGLTRSGSLLTNTYIKFSLPPLDMDFAIGTSNTNDQAFLGGTVVNAQLHFLVQNVGTTPAKLPIMEVFRNTSAWVNNFTASNRPSKAGLPESAASVSQTIADGAYYQYTADVTSMVRSWYKDPTTNHGLCLTPTLQQTNGSNFDFNVGFYAQDINGDEIMQTVIDVTYISNIGLENYWTYTSEGVGNGAVHVNHNSGFTTAVVTDTVSNNQRNGVAITHVYNDAMAVYDSPAGVGEVGKGFILNVQELLWEQYDGNGDLYYRHRDEDGTFHYYLPTATANRYEKETDPTSYLIVPSSSSQPIKLYYKDKSFKEFLNNCLSACEDANGNRIEITLNSTTGSEFCYPLAVKEVLANGVSRDTTLTWEEINNVPHLSSVTSPDGEVATFVYDESTPPRLIQILWNNRQTIHPGTNSSTGTQENLNFTYGTDGLLASVTDGWTQDGLTITRTGNQVSRLKKVVRVKADTTTIARTLSDYSFNYGDLTAVTEDNYTMTYRFDHCGRTVGVSDSEGNSKYFEFGATGGAQNKITLESKLIQRSSNLIVDPCFEQTGEGMGYAWNFNSNAYITSDSNEGYYAGAIMFGGQISQTVSIDKKGYYCLSADISLYDNAEVLITIKDPNGTIVGSSDTSPLVANLENNTVYTMCFEYPETAVYGGGSCVIDSVNFHAGETPLTLNHIVNGEFIGRLNQDGDPEGWVNISADSDAASYADSKLTLQGHPEQKNRVKQVIDLSGSSGDELIFSATVSNNGLPNLDDGDGTKTAVAITLAVHYTDGTYGYSTIFVQPDINAISHDISGSIIAAQEYDSVEIYLKNDYNFNEATFDDIWLAKESFGTRYTIDANGNVTGVKGRSGAESSMTYNSMGQALTQTDALGNVTENTYGKGNTNSLSTNNNQLLKTEAPMGQTTHYTYDIYGNVTSTRVGGSDFTTSTAVSQYLHCGETVYGNYGTTVSSVTDAFGNTTNYTYDSQTLKAQNVTAPNGVVSKYCYTYDDGPLYWQYVTEGADYLAAVFYGYEKDQLTTIQRDGFQYRLSEPLYSNESGASYQTTTTIDVYESDTADRLLAAQHYNDDGQLVKQVYGNYNDGSTATNEPYANSNLYQAKYDVIGRIREATRGENSSNIGVKQSYYYDREGNLSRTIESNKLFTKKLVTNFMYDLAGRLTKKTLSGRVNTTMTYEYDALDRVSKSVINGITSEYVYNANGQLTDQTYSGLPTISYNYDSLGRYKFTAWGMGETGNHLFRSVTYANGTQSGKPQQTERIGQVALRYAQMNTSLPADDRILYTYDSMGNITKETVYRGSTLVYTVDYTYDGLNQLLTATTKNSSGTVLHSESYTYVLDPDDVYGYSGNIATAAKDGNTYAYNYSTEWTDLLTSVTKNGTTVRSYQYDSIGNPLSDGTYNYDWIYGRTLYRVRQGTTDLARYTYDADGVRIRKVTGGTTTDYLTDGSTILRETKTGTVNATLNYVYGQTGLEYILYNGDSYWPLKNQQGDIIGLAKINSDYSATLICRYEYSAFGDLLSVTDANGNPITAANHIANLNPFRYRGYYYDTETGYYYLQSRYYDPEIGRFLNVDGYLSTGSGPLGYNMFAYCNNNPVNMGDPTGNAPKWIEDLFKWMVENVVEPGDAFIKKFVEDLRNYDENNESEDKVIKANFFSSYKSVPVIKLPIGDNAFSFRFMFIGDEVNEPNDIKHEYGHYVQYSQLGAYKYLAYVAIPSLWGYWTDVPTDQYYSLPWEYGADLFGGVERENYPYAKNARVVFYFEYWNKITGR